jgi:hypothetical protein
MLKSRGLWVKTTRADRLGPHEWWLPKLAEQLSASADKLTRWARRGWVHSRKTPARGLWVLWADSDELKRLRKLVAASLRVRTEYSIGLTTPKKRRRST